MKFKKIAALSTAVIMSASMLVGCGNNKSKENTDKSIYYWYDNRYWWGK